MPQMRGIRISQETAIPWYYHLLRWLMIALGVFIAAETSDGIAFAGPESLGPHGLITLALVVLVLSIFNVVLKPVLVLFTLPFVILTLGLGLWVINAFVFLLVARIHLIPGFEVAGFSSALWGSLVVSLMSFMANRWIGPRRIVTTRVLGGHSGRPPSARRDDDVIDV